MRNNGPLSRISEVIETSSPSVTRLVYRVRQNQAFFDQNEVIERSSQSCKFRPYLMCDRTKFLNPLLRLKTMDLAEVIH